MSFILPDGLAPEAYPLAWLVGNWRGTGIVEYPNIPRVTCVHDVEFDHDGGPYLSYRAQMTLTDEDGGDQVWSAESGFWRVPPRPPQGVTVKEGQSPLEVLISDASGIMSMYYGVVGSGRIDLATDLMARTESAAEVSGATRMYGLVKGRLLWAWDLAAFGHELRSYASAELERVESNGISHDD